MNTGFEPLPPATAPRVWPVGALTRAVASALEARFNPVAVRGEVSGFTRAGSGHCYFALKDEAGQLRCAMFRRAAGLLGFNPREGDQVEVRGRLTVYEPRGDLQLVVESMQRAGQGARRTCRCCWRRRRCKVRRRRPSCAPRYKSCICSRRLVKRQQPIWH